MCLDHPDRAGTRRQDRGSPRHHLWREPAGRRAADGRRPDRRTVALPRRDPRPQDRASLTEHRASSPCRCRATTTRSTPRRRSRWPTTWACRWRRSARRWQGFGGVKRRFTRTGDWNGVAIFDDYGHHPVEIAAVLRAARASTAGQVIAIVQPHRYTRLASLFDQFATCFNDADLVIVADTYAAGEQPIPGADRDCSGAGPEGARPPPRAAARRAGGHRAASSARSPSRATTSCSSAPAPSPTGPTRCRANSRRSP